MFEFIRLLAAFLGLLGGGDANNAYEIQQPEDGGTGNSGGG
jgi:hypothetical protein